MKWYKHKIDGAHGALSFFWSADRFEVIPLCTATIPEETIEYELCERGKARGVFPKVEKAKAAAIAFVTLLAGCSMTADEVPPHEVGAAQQAWLQASLPMGDRCFSERAMLGKLVTNTATLHEWCQNPDPGLQGCYHVRSYGEGYAGVDLLIVVDEKYDRPWLDLHELTHWLGDCSGVGSDPGHTDERLWGKRGVVETAANRMGYAEDIR